MCFVHWDSDSYAEHVFGFFRKINSDYFNLLFDVMTNSCGTGPLR